MHPPKKKVCPEETSGERTLYPSQGLPGNGGEAQLALARCQAQGEGVFLAQVFSLYSYRVEEDLDQILNLGSEPPPRPQPRARPPVAAKPVLPKKPAVPHSVGPRTTVSEPLPQVQAQAMDEMDILRYIQDHEAPDQATPSLF